MDTKYVIDTNILLDSPELILNYKPVILSHVIRELEKHKLNQNGDLAYKARRTTRFIEEHKDSVVFDFKDYVVSDERLDGNYTDNKIIQACIENPEYGLIANDFLLKFKAIGYGIKVLETAIVEDSNYSGIKKVKLNDSEMASFYENLDKNHYELLINQYLLVQNNHGLTVDKFRWDGNKHVKLKTPKGSKKKNIKPMNDEQACVIDMLHNKDIPIKFVSGTYGSGKTYLTVKLALQHVQDEGNHSKIMVIRNPIGSGEAIGWLKGSKEDKTQDFFKPFIQHLDGGEQEAEILEANGKLIREIPYYIKGLSIDDTFVVVDEAEDLDLKLLKLIGTRLGENSAVVFCGDFKQAESKFLGDNGLKQAIEKLKGHPLVGIVVMEEDVRSDASKVFAELD